MRVLFAASRSSSSIHRDGYDSPHRQSSICLDDLKVAIETCIGTSEPVEGHCVDGRLKKTVHVSGWVSPPCGNTLEAGHNAKSRLNR